MKYFFRYWQVILVGTLIASVLLTLECLVYYNQ